MSTDYYFLCMCLQSCSECLGRPNNGDSNREPTEYSHLEEKKVTKLKTVLEYEITDTKCLLTNIINIDTGENKKEFRCMLCKKVIDNNLYSIVECLNCNKYIGHRNCVKTWLEKNKICPNCPP